MEFNDNIKVIPAFKNSPGVKKVGIYARVSTARVEQMRSLAAQVSALAQYVYQRNDMIIRDIYIDVGSAKTGSSRREFSRLLQDCKNQKLNYVIIKSMSRFGRDQIYCVYGALKGIYGVSEGLGYETFLKREFRINNLSPANNISISYSDRKSVV